MKKLLLSVFSFLSVLMVQAQNNIELHLSPRLGAAPFALNTAVSAGNYEYKITRLEYYISEIKITHDGGQVTPVTDLHLLVRPAVDSLYDLGAYPDIVNVEAITFSVGVDEAHNHLDPATYPSDHPLAPQNPAMQWGWAAGYRFVAIEGKAGTNFAYDYEIHALGDANYKTLTLNTVAENHPNGDKTIHLIADYAQVLNSINVSAGLIVHGSTGKAITVMNNMKNVVFSAETVTMTIDPAFEGAFTVAPNPASSGAAMVNMALPAGFDYRVTLTDLIGRVVINQPVPVDLRSYPLINDLNTGIYLVHLWQNERPVAVEKLVIIR
jgi:hypothetical protein